MSTLADADWKIAERKRVVYQISEARWSMEGVIIPSSQNIGQRLDKLKNLLSRLKPSQTMCEPTQYLQAAKYLPNLRRTRQAVAVQTVDRIGQARNRP